MTVEETFVVHPPTPVDHGVEALDCPGTAADPPPAKPKPIRVCVLNSSYVGSDSAMKDYDDLCVGPHHYFGPADSDRVQCTVVPIRKATAYRDIRALAKSGKYDVFYNMCDGAKDEDRAGEEVVKALEEFNVPFTGCISRFYEMTKPDQHQMAFYYNILAPRYAVVESVEEAERKCASLRYPLIIKHPSGYSSVGLTRDCKVDSLAALLARLEPFLAEVQSALVEEFISGDEATVLACADDTQPDGIRVFEPVMMRFPDGEDFKHFDLKWLGFEGMEWSPVPASHRSYEKIKEVGRKAFKYMLGASGYGRSDLRIDRETGDVYFLEINANPGVMYPPGQEASADWILRLDPDYDHQRFALLQMDMARKRQKARTPLYAKDFDIQRGYHLRASRDISAGEVVFADEGRPTRLVTKSYVATHWNEEEQRGFSESAWCIGKDGHVYAISDIDPQRWRSFNHSCEPNMAFGANRSLNVVAVRDIRKGEELTMDYSTFCDSVARPFDCFCGTEACRKRISFC